MRKGQTFARIKIPRSPSGAGELRPRGLRFSLTTICLSLCLCPHCLPCPLKADVVGPPRRSGDRAGRPPQAGGRSGFPVPSRGPAWQPAEDREGLLPKLGRMGGAEAPSPRESADGHFCPQTELAGTSEKFFRAELRVGGGTWEGGALRSRYRRTRALAEVPTGLVTAAGHPAGPGSPTPAHPQGAWRSSEGSRRTGANGRT